MNNRDPRYTNLVSIEINIFKTIVRYHNRNIGTPPPLFKSLPLRFYEKPTLVPFLTN